MKSKRSWGMMLCALSLVVVLAALPGCHRKKKELQTDMTTPTGSTTETTSGSGLPEVDQAGLLFDSSSPSGLQLIYFDYDSYALRPDALETLKANADKIKAVPNVMVQIEGHCDERGTQEYNLALGERRALATREYLMSLGVSGDRLLTISYGEENPVDPGHDESAWSKNRRCQFNKAM